MLPYRDELQETRERGYANWSCNPDSEENSNFRSFRLVVATAEELFLSRGAQGALLLHDERRFWAISITQVTF